MLRKPLVDDPSAPPNNVAPKKTYLLTPKAPQAPQEPVTPATVGWRASVAPKRAPKTWGKRLGTIAIGVVAAAIGAAIVVALLLPSFVRRRCVEAAAAQGITLAMDDVRLGAGRFVLVNVTASAPELPKMSAKAAEIDVEMSGLDVARLVAKDGELALDGPYDDVKRVIGAWQRAHRGAGASAPLPRLVVEAMHVVWTRPFGEDGRIDALETRAEIARRGAELHVSTPHATLATEAATLGPWRFVYDRDDTDMRARLAFDPQLADGPSALLVGDAESVTSLDVTIARTPLTAIGVPAAALGLRGTEQIEATVHYRRASAVRVEARADVAIFALRVAAVPMPLDAKLELAAAGDPSNAVEVKKGELTVGPVHGAVVGTLRVFPDGARVELAWTAVPIPCASFLTLPSEPTGMPPALPDITAEVQRFLHATGIAKVTGEVRMTGALTFDSRDLGQTRVDVSPKACCNVSLFGAPAP